ncbi:MAG: hypothetical protein LUG65_04790 [Clostridiales bacterium]|nr:hypothetical protein [Clostridiales bacterium]
MVEIEYTVKCPLMNDEPIDMGTSFDIHMVVMGDTPKWTAPKRIYETPNYVEVCNNCPYHRND